MDTKPDLNMDMGFIKKPYAIQKQVMAPDGTLQTVFVDAKTGKPIPNPKGYQVVQQPVQPTTASTPRQETRDNPTNTDIVTGNADKKSETAVSKAVETTKEKNNYGYTDKPGIMGLAGFVPGPLGLLGTATNLGWNAKNQAAVSEQRTALGFSTQPGQRALGTAIDTNGYIGEGKVTAPSGKTSVAPVDFDGVGPNNRTAYTPEEARKREMMGLLTEANAEEKKAAIGTFNNQFPEQQGFMSKMIAASKGLMGNIFGSSATPSGVGTGLGFNTGSAAGAYGANSFPTKPSAPTNTATGYDPGRGPTVDTTGFSPGLY